MSSTSDRVRIAFSVTNCICYDQRVLKIAETVTRLKTDIIIIGRMRGDCCKSNAIPCKTKRFGMLIQNGLFFYAFYNIRLFFYLLFHRFDLLVSIDLDTLLPNIIISKLKRLPLVYDSHEYFTGVPEIQDRPFVKWVWKTIEKISFPHLKYVMTVSDSIATQYEIDYGIRPVTIRNCSRKTGDIIPFSRKELGVNEEDLLLILQGTGINVDRGGEELIEALGRTANVSLLVVGSGDLLNRLKEKVVDLNLSRCVKFIPKVPWEVLMRYTRAADAGLSLDKDTNINYRFSLPNKLFDYISAGIPVIAANLPEISKIVTEKKCGLIIPVVAPAEIADAISELRDNPGLLSELKKNSAKASESINWESESIKIAEFYKFILEPMKQAGERRATFKFF